MSIKSSDIPERLKRRIASAPRRLKAAPLDRLSLSLPYPPSVNHYWRMAQGRFYVSAEGNAYRAQVWAICGTDEVRFTGRVKLTFVAMPPDRRRRDIDNILKALLDALTYAKVYGDDSQIKKIGESEMLGFDPDVEPGVNVLIEAIPEKAKESA